MDTPLMKRAYNLGLKAVPNFLVLSEEQIVYYEQHLNELPEAISRGFVLPVYLDWKFSVECSIGPTYDTEKYQELAKIFLGGVYGDAKAVNAVTIPVASPSMLAKVYEVVEDGASKPIFESLGESRKKFQTLFQVGLFCLGHRDKLRSGGFGTLFELEGGFVARVCFTDHNWLEVLVIELSHANVWKAVYRHHVVSLQSLF